MPWPQPLAQQEPRQTGHQQRLRIDEDGAEADAGEAETLRLQPQEPGHVDAREGQPEQVHPPVPQGGQQACPVPQHQGHE